VQLDVVGVSKRAGKILIGEAKWGKKLVGRKVLVDLIKRSKRMPQVEGVWQVEYVLFAREGFTEEARLLATEVGARLVTLAEIERKLVEAESAL